MQYYYLGNEEKDGLTYLKRDHEEFRQLFSSFENQVLSSDQKKELVRMIVRQVVAHASAEERFIYPLFRAHLPNGKMIEERNCTDDQLKKEMLALLETMDPERDGERFDSTLRKFIVIEKEHIKQEEAWLEALRIFLTPKFICELEDIIIAAKANTPLHPHPEGPSHELLSRIIHPIGTIEHAIEGKSSI